MSAPQGRPASEADKPDASPPPPPEPVACRRCGTPGPVGDDGFCAGCEKALEQACL